MGCLVVAPWQRLLLLVATTERGGSLSRPKDLGALYLSGSTCVSKRASKCYTVYKAGICLYLGKYGGRSVWMLWWDWDKAGISDWAHKKPGCAACVFRSWWAAVVRLDRYRYRYWILDMNWDLLGIVCVRLAVVDDESGLFLIEYGPIAELFPAAMFEAHRRASMRRKLGHMGGAGGWLGSSSARFCLEVGGW
ncbi:hypothetical protein F5B22DRAFT_282090 [Xylaria bambusicola]|uniref:uncharacterized protein n=1 Tax=Xylaria bambusicola TaxID=326684 RepID=UPI00200817B8|nr:uncharacterized protein F5B22DRAFT_282090 [Xylaria bambusicola]KAI0512974.1 hypothetical protein F5B22DRAFT_282090 [Xylaria bambusicola]